MKVSEHTGINSKSKSLDFEPVKLADGVIATSTLYAQTTLEDIFQG